jgi:hypothetical protein
LFWENQRFFEKSFAATLFVVNNTGKAAARLSGAGGMIRA